MGIEQGRDRERQSIALKMLGKNIPLETIAEVTGLTIEQLQQLQSSPINDR
jgi:predicted transposase/invertase (TIGR01784 family)